MSARISTESDGCPQPRAGASVAGCRSVLMVGTNLAGKGGIRAVVQGYLEGGLFQRFEGVYVATHRYGTRWDKLTAALLGWRSIAAHLRKMDAPLVHVHLASHASFWRKSVVCLMSRLAGRPYLLHVHGGGFLNFYERESGPVARGCIRNVLRNAVLVIAVSAQWRERLLKICPDANVEVLTNAVALPDLAQRSTQRDSDPTVLFLGDLNRGKGVFDLVAAFARIANRFPRLRLVFGGVGSGEEVQRLASDLGVGHRIVLAGWLDHERKRDALSRATIFALPSYAEGMPMALLEAMSWELPVVATSVGGIPQLIANEYNGLLIGAGDVAGLAAALARLMDDEALRQQLGAGARRTVETGFTLESALAQLDQIYRRFGIASRREDTLP